MTRIAVIGANGFIGTRIVEMLHLSGAAEVIPVVRTPAGHAALSRFSLQSRVADALCQSSLERALSGCDVVVHAVAGDKRVVVGSIAPSYSAAKAAGVRRLIYLSSLVVHGYDPPVGLDETTRLKGGHEIDYCNWKVSAERKLHHVRQDGAVEVVILRPGIVFGPRSFWIREFATSLLLGRAYITNAGSGICPTIYVDNLIHAITRAVDADVDGEVFIVGDTELVSWRELYEPIVCVMGLNWNDDVHQLPGVAAPALMVRRLDRIAESLRSSSSWRHVPPPLRSLAQRAHHLVYGGAHDSNAIVASREMTLLQARRHKPSHAKATQLLGYDPHVSFADSMKATLGWLIFAGYRPLTMPDWPGDGF